MTALDYPARPTAAVANRTTGPVHLIDNDTLPWSHFVSGANAPDATIGTIGSLRAINASWYFSSFCYTTTNGSAIAYDFYVAAGTWRMEWYRDKRNDYGIVQYDVDGTNVGSTFDQYAAARVRWVNTVSGIVLGVGWHRFRSTIYGKNASSSNYLNVVAGLALTRTA